MTMGEVLGTFYALSNCGWMNAELFREWVQEPLPGACTIQSATSLLKWPLITLQPQYHMYGCRIGNHFLLTSTHHSCSPALDNGIFSSLKEHWMQGCHQFYTRSPGKIMMRRNFMSIPTSLDKGDGHVQRRWMLQCCRLSH